jgi:hypothetical protein
MYAEKRLVLACDYFHAADSEIHALHKGWSSLVPEIRIPETESLPETSVEIVADIRVAFGVK